MSGFGEIASDLAPSRLSSLPTSARPELVEGRSPAHASFVLPVPRQVSYPLPIPDNERFLLRPAPPFKLALDRKSFVPRRKAVTPN